jgi:serine/threonine-protein kinase
LVALKVLGPSLTRQADKIRFQREAQAIAKLKHPNIASVYFVGQDQQFGYMAMEYVEGVSLRRIIDELARTTQPDSTIDAYVKLDQEADTPPARTI